jgi:NTP pyrophosphatase (non-canonical NTP hydrolase)
VQRINLFASRAFQGPILRAIHSPQTEDPATITAPKYDVRTMDIDTLQQKLSDFAAERDWDRFHSPKNLAMALAAEAGELLELFQWLSEPESAALDGAERMAVEHELADVLIYLLRLADRLDVDLDAAVERKMQINAEKYPVAISKGNATKYSRRD